MSKLINDIHDYQLNLRKTQQVPCADFRQGWDIVRVAGAETRCYRFEVKLGYTVEVDEDLASLTKADVLTEVMKSTRHLIAEQVFGEFRPALLKLRQRAAARGDSESLYQVDTILDGMFKV